MKYTLKSTYIQLTLNIYEIFVKEILKISSDALEVILCISYALKLNASMTNLKI